MIKNSLVWSCLKRTINRVFPAWEAKKHITHSVHLRDQMSPLAVRVLDRLTESGHQAYLVGGAVRDLLLGRNPKDFDVVTSATPEEVRALFRNSRIIGKRFLLVHVYERSHIIEVSTFRTRSSEPGVLNARDNVYGSIEEDVWRRDFTINALYYDAKNHCILDWTNGLTDLKNGVVRLIGKPKIRFSEDPVRILRAMRLTAKLNFTLEARMVRDIPHLKHLLQQVSKARLSDEMRKLFLGGCAWSTFLVLHRFDCISFLLPHITFSEWMHQVCDRTDERARQSQGLTMGLFLANVLWPLFQKHAQPYKKRSEIVQAAQLVIAQQQQHCLLMKRTIESIQSIWMLQFALEKRCHKQIEELVAHRFFRAALHLFSLRAWSGEISTDLEQWWFRFRDASAEERTQLLRDLA